MKMEEIRQQLLLVADGLDDVEAARTIRTLAAATYRRKPVKRSRTKARKVTPELADRVRLYYRLNPDMANREIGAVFGIDGGRVSEILAGFRE